MIVRFQAAKPGVEYSFDISKVSCRGPYVYFWRAGNHHYYLEYDTGSGRLLEYRPDHNCDCPYEYMTHGWYAI